MPNPGDPQALNRYSYVGNRPTVNVDPSGHCIPELCPGVPDATPPGNPEGLRYQAYAQWLYNLILWIDRERAATGGVYNLTSNLIQETAAHELNSFLMDDPEMLGEQFYQELLMATPQLSAAAAGAGASVLMSGGGRVLGAVQRAYRSASGTPDSLTPRPGIDDVPGGGLSFFDSFDNPGVKPGKVVEIAPNVLRSLTVDYDNDPPGHVTIRPSSHTELVQWAATRGTGQVHPFTQELLNAVTGIFKKP